MRYPRTLLIGAAVAIVLIYFLIPILKQSEVVKKENPESSCKRSRKLACGNVFEIDMAAEQNAMNAIETYTCQTPQGAKTHPTTFPAPEVVLEPDAPSGTPFAFTLEGSGILISLLHETCLPQDGTTTVDAATCIAFGTQSVIGGRAGLDFVVLDAKSATKVRGKFICKL